MMLSGKFPRLYLFAARVGLIARGAVYFVIAALLLWAAISPFREDHGVGAMDAFIVLEQTDAGRAGLFLMSGGLIVYALWRWMTAALNDNNPDVEDDRSLTRFAMFISGTGYAFFALLGLTVAFGAGDPDSPDRIEQLARWLLSMPFGKWLLMGAGLTVIGFGITQFWLALSGQWRENLYLTEDIRRIIPIALFGVIGRAILFLLVAVFLLIGGWRADPDGVKGLAESLGWLRNQEYGFWLYLGSGFAIAAYGVFSILQARCYIIEERRCKSAII